MRTLSSALSAALGAPVQRPAVLVEVGFFPVQRWSSHATVTWNGQTWTARDVRVDGLQVGALSVSGTLVLGNADDVAGTLALSQGVQDRTIRIWGYDAAATGLADVVPLLPEAVGATAQIGSREVRIGLRHRTEFVSSPRTFVNAAAGFTHLLPGGTVLRINGQAVKLDRRG
jgi:pSer/pThr/pTyr-binding forkhead associated (FHA) protein